MKYKKITIHEYRGIQKPIEFNLERESIFPLVGVNECGKTTILEALLSFDFTADKQNRGRHLGDVENLYSLKEGKPRVSAEISISNKEFINVLTEILPEFDSSDQRLAKLVIERTGGSVENNIYEEFMERKEAFISSLPQMGREVNALSKKINDFYKKSPIIEKAKEEKICKVIITRNLSDPGKPYSLDLDVPLELATRIQNSVARKIVEKLDFILYFDDFRHDVPDRIPISQGADNEWTQILSTLFNKAHEDLDLMSLPTMDSRRRETALSRAESFLNKTLTDQWERFHLEDRKSLDIRIKFHEEDNEIELDIKETTKDGESFFFGIKDRSKGFFWFFNFVMRLEFNPKMGSEDRGIIYLLDEPGSYLHARAQDQLCKKLMELSHTSLVFYCTHSHHLLDPHIIPFNSIRIVEKSDQKEISLKSVFDHDSRRRVDAAFQPIFEALQIRPAAIDVHGEKVLVVEGVYDFLCFDMFKGGREIAILPAVSAHSIQYHISWLLAWGVDYRALWDNDKEGREKFDIAKAHFGEMEANKRFRKLPLEDGKRKRRLEDLFEARDLDMIRNHCKLPSNASFNKTILAAYYSKDRDAIIEKISKKTKGAFSSVFDSLWDW